MTFMFILNTRATPEGDDSAILVEACSLACICTAVAFGPRFGPRFGLVWDHELVYNLIVTSP